MSNKTEENKMIRITAEEFWSLPGKWNGIFYGKDKNVVYKEKGKFILSHDDVIKLRLQWLDYLKKTNMGEYIAYLTGRAYEISNEINNIAEELNSYFKSIKEFEDKRAIGALLIYLKSSTEHLYKIVEDVENSTK